MRVKMKLFIILQTTFLISVVCDSIPRLDPLVHIEQGLVRGHLDQDGMYSYFLGIPYAKVNLDNPFGSSEPHPDFGNEIFNAYKTVSCPQAIESDQQTLDCLRLNVYVPYTATSTNPLPVLVWISGERFAYKYGEFDDPRHFMDKGVVVVTINYRLGPYGFMCLDTPAVPGNQGLKDQFEALRWVKKNIAAFGGNPYEVTLGGFSAGSCSVLLHLLSSKEKLYKRVIAQSGTPLSYGMFAEADTEAAIKIAEQLGFNTTDTNQALSFLATTSPELVFKAFHELNLDLKPCKESSFSGIENFVENYPYYLSNPKKLKDTPVLIGHTSCEEQSFIHGYGDDYFNSDPFYDTIDDVFNLDDNQLKTAASTVRHFYLGDETVSQDLASKLAVYESDFVFNHPVQRIINLLLKEKANPIYSYVFSYLGDTNDTEASHGSDIPYLFNYSSSGNTDESKVMVERLTTLWANFIKYGNPTPASTDLLPVSWTPINENSRPYMVLDTEMKMKSRVYHERMAFWDLFYEKYGKNERMTRQCTILHHRH